MKSSTINKKCVFFGHRNFVSRCESDLKLTVEKLINSGITEFYIGAHGDFDKLAYKVCRELKLKYNNIKIMLVFTSEKLFKKDKAGYSISDYYPDTECISFFVEDKFYKARITETNKQMVDLCDMVCCFVDMSVNLSGAKTAIKYAMKKNKQIINLYK